MYVLDNDYMGTARVEWSPDDAVNIVVFAVYDIWSRGVATFRGRVTTPIQNWKTTSLNYGYTVTRNILECQLDCI